MNVIGLTHDGVPGDNTVKDGTVAAVGTEQRVVIIGSDTYQIAAANPREDRQNRVKLRVRAAGFYIEATAIPNRLVPHPWTLVVVTGARRSDRNIVSSSYCRTLH